MKAVLSQVAVSLLFFIYPVYTEDDPVLITVTAARIPQTFAELSRCLVITEMDSISDFPARDLADTLEITGIDIQERGPFGIQGDLSLRGSTFEQILIMINGIRINDSQTGHHNLDIPLTMYDLSQIEILKGHGSSAYGADAFGGIINLRTRIPEGNEFMSDIFLAEYNTQIISAGYGVSGNSFSQTISADYKRSDGHVYDTDFETITLSSRSLWQIPNGELQFMLGYLDKEFGAYDFYTPGADYPSREWTTTYFSSLSASLETGPMIITPKIFVRRHEDEFMLDFTNPSFYFNEHTTWAYGGEAEFMVPLRKSDTFLFGAGASLDKIESSQLGDHSLSGYDLFAQYAVMLNENLRLDAGLRSDTSDWGTEVSPSLGIVHHTTKHLKLRMSMGKAFRTPSFTELYYNSPSNTGDPDLRPEEAVSYEAGADFTPDSSTQFSFTVFERNQKNLIDWVGASITGPWTAANIGEVRVYGTECSLRKKWERLELNSTYTWSDFRNGDSDYISKYALRFLEHQAGMTILYHFPGQVNGSVHFQYNDRLEEDPYTLVSLKVSKKHGDYLYYFQANNIFNTEYEDVSGVPQPGAWYGIGIRCQPEL